MTMIGVYADWDGLPEPKRIGFQTAAGPTLASRTTYWVYTTSISMATFLPWANAIALISTIISGEATPAQ